MWGVSQWLKSKQYLIFSQLKHRKWKGTNTIQFGEKKQLKFCVFKPDFCGQSWHNLWGHIEQPSLLDWQVNKLSNHILGVIMGLALLSGSRPGWLSLHCNRGLFCDRPLQLASLFGHHRPDRGQMDPDFSTGFNWIIKEGCTLTGINRL